ncbi:MAG TPA: SURF1 family protein [Alphaproteobacteria bacterium]|nr:SURF1 family protein [Alphaproteobacteria bacterium]
MAFRPRPWPTAIAVIGVAILISLGTWQLHRKAWKEELLAAIAARSDAAPVPLPAKIDDPGQWSFRRVRVDGRFDNAHALWLYGRTRDGKAGIHLLVPLLREDEPAVLIDRGFVPFAEGNRLERFASTDASVEIEGIVRLPESGGWFTPADRPDDNIWYRVQPDAMGAKLGLQLLPVYVAAAPSEEPGWPAGTGGTERAGIRNEHLNYAIFWYTMAAALAVIYLLSSWSRSR